MVMTHHSSEDYNVTAARAAVGAREKLQRIIQAGLPSAQKAVAQMQWQQDNMVDVLARNDRMRFNVTEQGLTMQNGDVGRALPLTEHAFTQLLARADIPVPPRFARALLSSEATPIRSMLPSILETLNRNAADTAKPERSLVRIVDSRVHAVLSDSYKRINSAPQLEAFCATSKAHGLVPMFGCNTELRNHFRVVLPTILEPIPNEPMVIGLEWSNSDFGAGANAVRMFILRMWCTNTAMGESVLRQVHLGRQLDANTFSERTMRLQSQTDASAMQDVVANFMHADRIGEFCTKVRAAHDAKIDTGKAIENMYKSSKVTKQEKDRLAGIAQTQDVEILPSVGGESVWRFSNMFSYLAQQTENPVRARELEQIAGDVLTTYVPRAGTVRALAASNA